MKKLLVTTSWDDGHKFDVRLAKLLAKYNIKGTFYISPKNHEFASDEFLSPEELKTLACSFELGGHTITHRSLTDISDDEARKEINESRDYLRKITGHAPKAFCYPRGKFHNKHVSMVGDAGFIYARTIKRLCFNFPKKLLISDTTVNTYNHWSDLPKIAVLAGFNPFKIVKYFQWDNLAKALFDRALETGGVYHLWGHSWEVDGHGDWEKLESVLAYISNRQNATYVSNGDIPEHQPKKKILVASPYFPPHFGGTQFYVYNIAKRLQNDLDLEICIVTSGVRGFKTVKETYEGLTVYRLGYLFKISNTPVNPLWLFTLRRIIKKENISMVNAHAPVLGMSDCAAFAAGKIPFVLTYHSGTMKKGKMPQDILIWLYENGPFRFLLRRADFIITSSDYVRFEFLNKYLYKTQTVTPAVDAKLFHPGPKKAQQRTVLFVASLTRAEQHKGLKILIQSFVLLKEKLSDIRLVIVGDGDMRKEYEDQVKPLGISNSIVFKGRLTGEPLAEAFRDTDIFVLPSLAPSESFGMVIVEAMASGKPVIGTRAGGIPRVIDDEKNGLLVDSADVKGLAQAIERLFNDPELANKFGENGHKKALTHYDWDVQAAAYSAILKEFIPIKPHIAQLVGYYPPHIGGMEIVAHEISRELTLRYYPLSVFTSNIGNVGAIGIEDSECNVKRMRGIEVAHTPLLWSLPFRLMCMPKGSIIHVHISQAGMPEIAMLIAKLRNFSLVAHFHLDINATGRLGLILPFYKKYFLGPVLRAADKVIVFSPEQAIIVREKYHVKESNLAIIPNGVGQEFFYRNTRPLPTERLNLLYIGRLNKQKRVDRLIDALPLVTIPYSLTIIGNGEDRKKLEMQVKNLGLKNISFEGKKYGDELRSYQRVADAFVIPSDLEGMPLVVLEAMAAGLPIIGSNVPGIQELVRNVGVLVDNPSPETFAKAIDKIWQNKSDLSVLSKKSLEKAELYTWERLVAKLETVYSEINQ